VPQKIEHDISASWNVHPGWSTITMHHSGHLIGPQLTIVQFYIVYQLPTCSHHITVLKIGIPHGNSSELPVTHRGAMQGGPMIKARRRKRPGKTFGMTPTTTSSPCMAGAWLATRPWR